VNPAHTVCPQTVPSGSGLQVPALPLTLQLWQALVQAVLQQTPSTQKPDAQALLLVPQADPAGRLATHLLPMHWNAPVHCASELQAVRQAVPPALQA
jgi:hypothetical protein